MVYRSLGVLPVGDLAGSLHRVREEGGEVVLTQGEDGSHAYAVIRDPVGVYLALAPG